MDLTEVIRPEAVEPCCRRARTYLSVARAAAHRLLLSAEVEDHPAQRDDLLRSMLVFACAGMDRSCKALVEDAFPALARMDEMVEDSLAKFAAQHMSQGPGLSASAIAQLLLDPRSPREALLGEFVKKLTGDSLQSVGQLFKVCAALRVPDGYFKQHDGDLREVFNARNAVVHEMDIASGADDTLKENVQRTKRSQDEYVVMASGALSAANYLVKAASDAVRDARATSPFWSAVEEEEVD
jgi:hypothetical protein